MPPESPGESAPTQPPAGSATLPEGLINRGVMFVNETPPGMVGGVEDAVSRAKREERNRRRREREAEKRDRQARAAEAADEVGESAIAGVTSTRAGESVRYIDTGAPRITIHGPTYEAPTYEAPTFNNNPINVNSPDMNPTINVNGGGGGGESRGDHDHDPDDHDRPRDDEELDQLRQQLEEMRGQMEGLNQRIAELEQQNQELQQRNQELEEENERLRARIEELENPPPPPGPTPEQITEAQTNLSVARDELAKYDIRRSARITDGFSKRRKEDAQGYEDALDNYKQALEAVAQIMIAEQRAQGKDDAAIRRSLTEARYGESEAYAKRVVEINEENFNSLSGFKKRYAKLLRRWADLPTKYKVGIGVGLGIAVGFGSVMTGGGLAVLAGGSAARFSLGLVNHQASLRNVSRHSLERQLEEIKKRQREALRNLGSSDLDTYTDDIVEETEKERRANTRGNIRRNRWGTAVMVGGAALAATGLAHAAGIDTIPDTGWLRLHTPHLPGHIHNPFGGGDHHSGNIPNGHTGGGPGFPGSHAAPNLPSNFNMDTIHAHNTTEFVNNTFGHGGLLDRQGVKVDGLTPEKARHLAEYLQNHHWRVVEGMQANGHGALEQHVVGASSWQNGINNPSHAEAWTSKQELQHAMQIAKNKFGIDFRMES